jgi:hypothetical protein
MRLIVLQTLILLFTSISMAAQSVSGKIQLIPGKNITVNTEIKNTMVQQAGAQAINFSVNGSVMHQYSILSKSEVDFLIQHKPERLQFQFEGMGQKKSFDSDNREDLKGPFGKQFQEFFKARYTATISSSGKTIKVSPQKISLGNVDERLIVITGMLKDLTNVVYPPQIGEPCFFSVLPEKGASLGDIWSDSTVTDNQKSATNYKLSAITDSTIVVDFSTISTSTVKTEMMGMPATTHLKNSTTGIITLDRTTGLIRKKTSLTESNGTTETRGTTVPINGKTEITITVREKHQ